MISNIDIDRNNSTIQLINLNDEIEENAVSNTTSNIIDLINRYIIDNEQVVETNFHRNLRVFTEISAATFIVASKIPFINISRTFAGYETTSEEILGWILAFCNTSSFAILDAYSIYKITYDIIKPVSNEEKNLSSVHRSYKVDLILRLIAIIGASISVIPHAYVGYEYNNQIIWMALLAAAGCLPVPTYSLYLSLVTSRNHFCVDRYFKEINSVKYKIIESINNSRKELLNESATDLTDSYLELLQLKNIDNSINKVNEFFRFLSSKKQENQTSKSIWRNITTVCSKTMSSLFSVTVMGYLGKIGYDFASSLSNSYAVGGVTAVAVASCSGYLMYRLMGQATDFYFDKSSSLCSKKVYSNWGERVHPKIALISKLAALSVNALAFAPTVQVVQDHFDGAIESYFEVVTPISFFVILSFLSQGLIDELCEELIVKTGNDHQKTLIEADRNLKKLSLIIKNLSPSEVSNLLCNLNEDIIKSLGEELATSIQKIRDKEESLLNYENS